MDVKPVIADNVCPLIAELEQKVDRLECIARQQQQAIEELERKRPRPTSVSLRNRSNSPAAGRQIAAAGTSINLASPTPHATAFVDAKPPVPMATAMASDGDVKPVSADNGCPRLAELEQKVGRLERIFQQQNQTIEELERRAREADERYRQLRAELDKYAQFVTQV